jgi:hypothetical protein
MSFPVYCTQRFFPFKLNELIDKDSYTVQEFVKDKDIMSIAKDILILVKYPLKAGKPDDEHKYSAFNGLYHYNRIIKWDYWQKGEETLSIFVGDCEDSSIAFVTCLRAKDVSNDDVYEVLGYVTKENDELGRREFLGYHGWSVSKNIPDDKWRLYESTLDFPPSEYPVIEDIRKPFYYNGIIYHPEQIFNDMEYEEIISSEGLFMKEKDVKRRVKKHIEIAKAFKGCSRIEKAIGRSGVGLIRYGRLIHKLKEV